MELITINIDDYKPYPTNPNSHPDAQLVELGRSLEEFDQVKNVVVWQGHYIAGHGLVEAARRLGMAHLAAVDVSHWDRKRAEAFMVADNRLPELAVMNFDILGDLLKSFDDPLEIPGIDADFLAGLDAFGGKGKAKDAGPQIDKAAELQKVWGTALGQVWELGEHRLAVGDCTDKAVVEAVMRGERADACIADPPYGIEFNTDYTRFTIQSGKNNKYTPIANDDKPFDPTPYLGYQSVVLWGANYYAGKLPVGTWLVWDKRFVNGKAWLSDAEIAWMKSGTGVYIFSLTSQGFVRPEPVQHPTQKPVSLIEWCIEKSKAGNVIYDPFSGSGTTLIACQQLNRRCRAIEIDPGYAAVAIQRFVDLATGYEPQLVSK